MKVVRHEIINKCDPVRQSPIKATNYTEIIIDCRPRLKNKFSQLGFLKD